MIKFELRPSVYLDEEISKDSGFLQRYSDSYDVSVAEYAAGEFIPNAHKIGDLMIGSVYKTISDAHRVSSYSSAVAKSIESIGNSELTSKGILILDADNYSSYFSRTMRRTTKAVDTIINNLKNSEVLRAMLPFEISCVVITSCEGKLQLLEENGFNRFDSDATVYWAQVK